MRESKHCQKIIKEKLNAFLLKGEKKMKKYIVYLIIGLFTFSMMFVSGCKDVAVSELEKVVEEIAETVDEVGEEVTTEEASAEEEITGEIKFMHADSDITNKETWEITVDNFMKKYPGVKVEIIATEMELYETQKLPLAISSQNPPDVFFNWAGLSNRSYIREGFYLDITEEMRSIEDTLTPSILNITTINDMVYGAPYGAQRMCIFYNKELFNKYGISIPKTLDEYRNVCQTFLDNGITPIAFGHKDLVDSYGLWMQIIQPLAGTDDDLANMFLEPDKLNNEAMIESFKIMKEFAQKGYFGDALSYTREEALYLWAAGEAAMYARNSEIFSNVYDLLGKAPDYNSFEYGIFPIPGIDGPHVPSFSVCLIGHAKTKYPEATKAFLKYVLSGENGANFIERSLSPVNTSVVALENAMSENSLDPLTSEMVEFLKDSDVRITRDPWDFWVPSGYYSIMIELVQKMMWDEAYTPEQAAADMNTGYSESYESETQDK